MIDLSSGKQTVLAVLPAIEDRISLENILNGSNWKVRFARSPRRKRAGSDLTSIGAVLTDAHLPDGRGWKDVLLELQRTPNAPPLIVSDRLADEALWAEVLNLGGYDVLAKPFERKEVLHAVSTACGFRRRHAASFDPRPMQQKVHWSVA